MELLEEMLNPLFSPAQDFIFPLAWAWSEQQLYSYLEESEAELEEFEVEAAPKREFDWELILDLWQDVFRELKEEGEFNLNQLNQLPPAEKERWLSQEINLELFMMFIITDIKLRLVEEYPGLDERLLLFKRLTEKNEEFAELAGKRVKAELNAGAEKLNLLDQFIISPYKIYLEAE